MDDQRGLLTKEQLELPLFLQLSLDQEKLLDENQTESSSDANPRKTKTKESESTQSSAGTTGRSPDSKSEGKNIKESEV